MKKKILLLFLFCASACLGVWAVVHFTDLRHNRMFQTAIDSRNLTKTTPADVWAAAVEKVKQDRGEPAGGYAAVETPAELRHYSERYWFLATQVAEIEEHKIYTCQDFLDLAAMIRRGEMVTLPAVTESYVLYGVGEKADEASFSRFEEDKALLDEVYGQPENRRKLFQDYEALQTLAKNFAGRSFDINNPSDRQSMKISMLSSLRPQALRIMEEVAAAYHRQFGRPLPVSSLVRPEQYQHALRRVNRNAVLIDTPPHSTGLAFDIDYRYMSAAEQLFVMGELARLKNQGRIEVIRERNANYHVFAFIDGARPSDVLISASLEKAGAPVQQAHHAEAKPAKAKQKVKSRAAKPRRPRTNVRKRRR